MNTELTPDNLFIAADYFNDLAKDLMDMRGLLRVQLQDLIEHQAPDEEIKAKKQDISETSTRVSRVVQKANELDTKGIIATLVATDEAMERISQAKDGVLKAVKKIEDIGRVFHYIDLFIRVGSAIVSAANTISPPAQIKAIIEAINILYQEDFNENL